jgi:hypothetical protein
MKHHILLALAIVGTLYCFQRLKADYREEVIARWDTAINGHFFENRFSGTYALVNELRSRGTDVDKAVLKELWTRPNRHGVMFFFEVIGVMGGLNIFVVNALPPLTGFALLEDLIEKVKWSRADVFEVLLTPCARHWSYRKDTIFSVAAQNWNASLLRQLIELVKREGGDVGRIFGMQLQCGTANGGLEDAGTLLNALCEPYDKVAHIDNMDVLVEELKKAGWDNQAICDWVSARNHGGRTAALTACRWLPGTCDEEKSLICIEKLCSILREHGGDPAAFLNAESCEGWTVLGLLRRSVSAAARLRELGATNEGHRPKAMAK